MLKQLVSSGKFWMIFWLCVTCSMMVWGALTIAFWLDSVVNLNLLSVFALLLACGAGFQSSLTMRKADPEDPV